MIAKTRVAVQPVVNALTKCGGPTSRPPDPTQLALDLTGRDYISYSAITTYMRCPLRYRFAYVETRPPEFVAGSLVFGRAIHAAIERHFRLLFEGASAPTLDDLISVYQDAWQEDPTAPIRLGKTETEKGLQDLASRILKAFQNSAPLQTETTLLAVEEELRGPVITDCPDLLGRLDLITLEPDTLTVTDFKTSRSTWNNGKVQEAAPQQLLYAELVKPLAQSFDRPIRLQWIVLTKTKQPSVEVHTLTPKAEQIARTKAVVRHVWRAISARHFYPAPSTMNCSSCPHQTACREWEG